MNVHKQLILNVSQDNYSEANKKLEALIEQKLRQRIEKSLETIDEGLFDRLSAKTSAIGAGLKAKTQNFITKASAKPKAAVQAAVGAVTGKGFNDAQETLAQADKDIASNDPRKKAKAAQADSLINSFAKDLSTLYPDVNVKKALSNLRTQLNFSKA